jgi:hypothetical protein
MALPKLEAPKYSLTVPSTGESIEYRPYLVKEEKMLLMAQESNDQKRIMNSICELVDVCTFNSIKAKELPIFDIEYIFIKLRAKSVGESTALKMPCTHDGCSAKTDVDVNLDLIQVTMPEKIENKVEITDKVGVVMKYPTIDGISKAKTGSDFENVMGVLVASIDYIYDENDVYNANDETEESLREFLEQLNADQFKKVQAFFEKMPKVEDTIAWKCSGCGKDNKLVVSGLQSFFG